MKITDSKGAITQLYETTDNIEIYTTIEEDDFKNKLWTATDKYGNILWSDYDYYDLLDYLYDFSKINSDEYRDLYNL